MRKQLTSTNGSDAVPIERFQASIDGLLSVVRDEVGADGYALYELDEAKRALVLRSGSERTAGHAGLVSLPLKGPAGLAGLLEFEFPANAIPTDAQRELLERTAESISALLRSARSTALLIHLTARIAELEAQLADVKITERARGLAEQRDVDRRSELLHSHIVSVLNSCHFEEQLTAHVRELEERLEERRVVAEAKATLQRTRQITEEQAYRTLRDASRRARKKLATVAQEVLDGRLVLVERVRLSA